MNTARIVVPVIALSAGGVAAYLARGAGEPLPAAPAAQQLPTVEVLVAKSDIGLGQTVKPDDLQWQTWPAATANNFIRRADRADAIKAVVGSIARSPFIAGEPIREQKLVRADGSGLPNDGVDVILSKREKNPDRNAPDIVSSETILVNVRVLAIDQAPKEKEGQNTVVGKTATLEMKSEQVETLARARQSGTLPLALRSIADVNTVENTSDDQAPKRGASISLVRYGVSGQATTQK